MAIPNILLGTILLFFGRKLFWLFVGIAGFLVGMELSAEFLSDQSDWVRWVVSIGAGLIGALLAVVTQRVAFAIGGFFAGSYIAMAVVAHFGIETSPNTIESHIQTLLRRQFCRSTGEYARDMFALVTLDREPSG